MDTETKSMEQCAREFRDSLQADLDRIDRVREMDNRSGGRFGLVDMSRQDLVDSSQVPVRIPAIVRIGDENFAIDRSFLHFGRFLMFGPLTLSMMVPIP